MKTLRAAHNARIATVKSNVSGGGIRAVKRSFLRTGTEAKLGRRCPAGGLFPAVAARPPGAADLDVRHTPNRRSGAAAGTGNPPRIATLGIGGRQYFLGGNS